MGRGSSFYRRRRNDKIDYLLCCFVFRIEVRITKSILLIVDLQRGFITPKTKKVIDVIENAINTLDFEVCVYSRFYNNEETSFSRILNWERFQSVEEQEIVLPIVDGNKIVSKDTYSAVTRDLKRIIEECKIERAYLCGIDTDSCVLATAFELFDNGVEPVIIIDGCASTGGDEYHHAAELIMKRSFGKENVNPLSCYIGGKKRKPHFLLLIC